MDGVFNTARMMWNLFSGKQAENSEETTKKEEQEQDSIKISIKQDEMYSIRAWISMACFMREAHKYGEAEKTFDKAMEMMIKGSGFNYKDCITMSSLNLEMGRNYVHLGKVEHATQCFNKVCELEVSLMDKGEAMAELAWLELDEGSDASLGRAKAIIEKLQQMTQCRRIEQLWNHLLGNYYLLKQDNNSALKHYEKAVELDTACVDSLAVLGDIYFHQMQDKTKAHLMWSRAFDIDPYNNNLSHYKLAKHIIKHEHNLEKTRKVLDIGLKLDPEDVNSHYLMAVCLEELEAEKTPGVQKELVIFHYAEAVRLGCEKKELYRRFSEYLVELKNYNWALGVLNSGLKNAKEHTVYILYLRQQFYEITMQNYRAALEDCEHILRLISQANITQQAYDGIVSKDIIKDKIVELKEKV
ncbi:predicted protein [Naegleria gruberi]|uniref:Predicted protein n=1 Tax=Naegleria gruberi TaxID=5762 RepID=D2W3U0_NAEGR|nr:uncharacterized protein NAEGRDRAFT_54486 [Naegleria gruberi]EFC36231.1 predicted protein [Naegleria gruberi]|eukprot:XP_002668975.1 predicted protein [Naegleria gruberi strain NEG-M]